MTVIRRKHFWKCKNWLVVTAKSYKLCRICIVLIFTWQLYVDMNVKQMRKIL